MPAKITIICDTPESERAPRWQDESIICYSDFGKDIHGLIYGVGNDIARATIDLRRLALFQGWRTHGDELICPGCVRRMQR